MSGAFQEVQEKIKNTVLYHYRHHILLLLSFLQQFIGSSSLYLGFWKAGQYRKYEIAVHNDVMLLTLLISPELTKIAQYYFA